MLVMRCPGDEPGKRNLGHVIDGASASQLSAFLKANAKPVTSVDPDRKDFSDLAAFGKSVGDARIVVLGEQSHGEGNVFSLKARLVEYLHEQKGFNVLVWESGMFDGAKIWQDVKAGAATDTEAQGSLFFMYARAQQVKPLFEYIDAQKHTSSPLIMTAMDTPHAGAKSQKLLLAELVDFLNQNGFGAITSGPDWAGFMSVATPVIALQSPPTGQQAAAFKRIVDAIKTELPTLTNDTLVFPNSAGFWLQIVKSLDAQYQTLIDPSTNTRDPQMADNVRFLADRMFAGQKLIIWAHNGHALNLFTAMGASLKPVYAKNIYTAIFTGSTGTFLNFDSLQPVNVSPPLPNTWETAWHKAGATLSFLDVRGNAEKPAAMPFFKGTLSLRLAFYQDGRFSGAANGGLNSFSDGIFYLNQIQPVVMK